MYIQWIGQENHDTRKIGGRGLIIYYCASTSTIVNAITVVNAIKMDDQWLMIGDLESTFLGDRWRRQR